MRGVWFASGFQILERISDRSIYDDILQSLEKELRPETLLPYRKVASDPRSRLKRRKSPTVKDFQKRLKCRIECLSPWYTMCLYTLQSLEKELRPETLLPADITLHLVIPLLICTHRFFVAKIRSLSRISLVSIWKAVNNVFEAQCKRIMSDTCQARNFQLKRFWYRLPPLKYPLKVIYIENLQYCSVFRV